ncbi:MarR family transcriptional regulator [Streptomyces sp. NPDC059003]|uniref:MarR family transcriptional regulator n=1 Tax=Streptomyces sp. NPDC059003 TaxID=3346691 RepID=UPI00369789F7
MTAAAGMPQRTERGGLLTALPALSRRIHALLVEGDIHGAYDCGSSRCGQRTSAHAWATTRAIAADAVRAGWRESDFFQIMLDGPYKGGHDARGLLHRRGHDHAVAWLHRAWKGARQHVHSTDRLASRHDFHASLAALRTRIERTPWQGIAGKTDLRNLLARIAICEQTGGWDHTVSERELAERMGCSRATARNSNQRLLQTRLLRQLNHGSARHGARWMLMSHVSLSQLQSTPQGPQAGGAMNGPTARQPLGDADINSRVATALMGLDAFAHHGLGGSGLAVVAALAEHDGQTIGQLQSTACVSRSTAYRQITRLQDLGLVRRVGELCYLSPTGLEGIEAAKEDCPRPVEGWVHAAHRLGTLGAARRRRARHRQQRDVWRLVLLRLTEHRRPSVSIPHPSRASPEHLSPDGQAVDPVTEEIIRDLYIASDGCWILDHGGDGLQEHREGSAHGVGPGAGSRLGHSPQAVLR